MQDAQVLSKLALRSVIEDQESEPSSATSSQHTSSFTHTSSSHSVSTAPTSRLSRTMSTESSSLNGHAGENGTYKYDRHLPERQPPPSGPPPLPPVAGPSRPPRPARISMSSLRQAPPPSHPPPTGALPQIPTSPSSSRTPPRSPAGAGPPISPRASSLTPSNPPSSNSATSAQLAQSLPIPEPPGSQKRIPSRQLLQSALDLAQRAVEMDQANDVIGALEAYREAVARLKSVMERVGLEGKDAKGKGKAEEEGRTLRGIHDAYVARIQLLSSYETSEEFQSQQQHGRTPSYSSIRSQPSPPMRISSLAPGEIVSRMEANRPPMSPTTTTSRPSTDDGARGIGEFMMADQSFDATSPTRPTAQPPPTKVPFPSNETLPAEDLPPRRDSHLQNGTPTIAPSASIPSLKSTSPETPRRVRLNRPSMGLEDEAGLTSADGLLSDSEEVLDATPMGTAVNKTLPSLPPSHSRTTSLSRLLISSSTAQGTISQRRQKPSSSPSLESRSSLRARSRSQTGERPEEVFQVDSEADAVPPLPNLRKKLSFPSRSSRSSDTQSNLAPPLSLSRRSHSPSSITIPPSMSSQSSSLISPIHELQPQEALHRPYHLLRVIRISMDPEGSGAYLTGAIHIPSALWNASQGSSSAGKSASSTLPGPKIFAQETKVRIMDALLLHLEIIRHVGAILLEGPREVLYGVPGVAAPKVGSAKIGQIGQEFLAALDAFEEEMDGGHKGLAKAGVGVGGWKGKKASSSGMSWGSKMVSRMDKMTNSKGMESSDKYVDLLATFCSTLQIIDEHLSNFTGPCTPAYHCLSEASYRAVEQRLLSATDFVRVAVVPFVLDDFKLFFHRYLRAGMNYLEA